MVKHLETPIIAWSFAPQPQRLKGLNVEDHQADQVQGTLLESKVVSLWNYYKILQDFQVFTPSPSDWVNRAAAGFIAIYAEHLGTRLHFPHLFIIKIFNLYKIIPV